MLFYRQILIKYQNYDIFNLYTYKAKFNLEYY
jgi:hypothetical protein